MNADFKNDKLLVKFWFIKYTHGKEEVIDSSYERKERETYFHIYYVACY